MSLNPLNKNYRDSPGGASSADTAIVQDIAISRRSDSLSSSSSNCLAQADSHSRGLEDRTDRTDRESMISTSARFSTADG